MVDRVVIAVVHLNFTLTNANNLLTPVNQIFIE